MSKLLIVMLIVAVVGVVFWFFYESKDLAHVRNIKIGQKTFSVELALSPKDQARGLSGRDSLPKNNGMLFIFPTSAKKSFHMKDMRFPIDIIWINENMNIVGITKNIQPWQGPFGELYASPSKVKFVLEVNAGESDGLVTGDTATIR